MQNTCTNYDDGVDGDGGDGGGGGDEQAMACLIVIIHVWTDV